MDETTQCLLISFTSPLDLDSMMAKLVGTSHRVTETLRIKAL